MTTHPVHIVDNDGNLNPTALVPFCSISGNYSAMGVKIDQVEVPVCNSFRPKILRDQLCYTVDLNKFKQKIKFNKNVFFSFFIDYNEDRDLLTIFDDRKNINIEENGIIIETIGIHLVNFE